MVAPPSPYGGGWSDEATVGGRIVMKGSPWFLWELRPGVHVEHGVQVTVNALGMRGGEVGARTAPRLLALGDSTAYGYGVADDAVFTAMLAASVPAEILNAAVPGYSTYQSMNTLDARGLALDPDLLLIGNLWSDNHFGSFVDRELLATYAGWQATRLQRIRSHLDRSALFRWADWLVRVRGQAAHARKVGWTMGREGVPTGLRRVALNDYAENLDSMARRLHERGGAVAFLLPANRDDLLRRTPNPAWTPYREVMRDTASRWGAPLVDVPAAFAATELSAEELFLDDMHPTARGHAVMAAAVVAALAGWPTVAIRLKEPSPKPIFSDTFLQMQPPLR